MNTSDSIDQKISLALVEYVYKQMYVGLLSSLFCAGIIFFGLLYSPVETVNLAFWMLFFCIITVARTVMVMMYKKHDHTNTVLWERLYIFGALLGGLSWGIPGIFFFHQVYPVQQTLMILMLAGVTAGAVSLSAAIPKAATAFLIFSIVPYIVSMALLNNKTYLLFDAAMTLYLLYSIVLSLKAYHTIRKSIFLQFENANLLKNLMEAKKQLELNNKQLEQTATHDPLTKVANRALFEINLQEMIRRSSRNEQILGLMYFDVDKFKSINDQYGHHVGDYVLLVLAKRLKNFFGSTDIIARLGGDEFTIIIENANNVDEIVNTAKIICELLSNKIQINDIELNVSVSIGISIYPDDGTNAEKLMQCADKNMYRIKMNGGNNFYLQQKTIA